MDTVFALASGSTRAGVAVIRVSGALALDALKKLSGKDDFTPRQAQVCTFADDGSAIDRGVALYFKSPASFTGEDVAEFQVHGGKSVIDALIAALSKIKGCRMAEPGEFTRRAFENGKMDLTEAEAVADLIDAETQAQRLQALDQMGGGLSQLYGGWAENLKKLLAHQEAEIEFPDEDLPAGLSSSLLKPLQNLISEIKTHLDDGHRGERLRDGILVAIIGAPNAGKSSLLNALVRRDVAIVSDEAGTTRDVIEAHLDLGGYPVILADTAGLRLDVGKVEAEGIRRAKILSRDADLKIALFDGTGDKDPETLNEIDERTVIVCSKSDLVKKKGDDFYISSSTGDGLDALLKTLTEKVAALFARKSGPSLTRQRHREALTETLAMLERGSTAAMPELAAEDLRLALRSLGKVTGRVHIEELLDVIFRDFCIGK